MRGRTGSVSVPKSRLKCLQILCKIFDVFIRERELARFPKSRLTSKSFCKILMYSYDRESWLGYRDLNFSKRDIGQRAGKFCHMSTLSRCTGTNSSQQRMRYTVDDVAGRFPHTTWWIFYLFSSRNPG